MSVLATSWSKAMGLRVPVLNAPMGGVAGGDLAAAVSADGGLGMIGIGSAGTVSFLQHEAARARQRGAVFGIGLVDWVVAHTPALLDVALAATPTVLAVSFADKWDWVPRARAEGVVAITQISDVDEARHAEQAGIDVVVARGSEGGGHGNPRVATLPLVAGVLDAVTIPVLAAGGITSPRAVAAMLAAGASGVWLGTAFAACTESLNPPQSRTALLSATETDTVITDVFDLALGYPWPAQFKERVLRNPFWQQWAGHHPVLTRDGDAAQALRTAFSASDGRSLPIDAGQGVGQITESRSAAEIIRWLCGGAEERLKLLAQDQN